MVITNPDYVAPDETTFDVEKPIRSEQGLMLAGNPIAIAIGKNGSPVVRSGWHPYDMLNIGDGADGLIYDFAVSGAVGQVITPDFEDGYEYRILIEGVSTSLGGDADLNFSVYLASSASYATDVQVGSTSSGSGLGLVYGEITVNAPRRVTSQHRVDTTSSLYNSTSNVLIPSDVVTYVANSPTAQKILRARIRWASGNIDAGKMYMHRRLAL